MVAGAFTVADLKAIAATRAAAKMHTTAPAKPTGAVKTDRVSLSANAKAPSAAEPEPKKPHLSFWQKAKAFGSGLLRPSLILDNAATAAIVSIDGVAGLAAAPATIPAGAFAAGLSAIAGVHYLSKSQSELKNPKTVQEEKAGYKDWGTGTGFAIDAVVNAVAVADLVASAFFEELAG